MRSIREVTLLNLKLQRTVFLVILDQVDKGELPAIIKDKAARAFHLFISMIIDLEDDAYLEPYGDTLDKLDWGDNDTLPMP